MRRVIELLTLGAATLVLAAACSSSDPAVTTGSSAGGSPTTTAAPAGTAAPGGGAGTTTPSAGTPSAATLAGQTFISTSVTGHDLVAGTEITMTFTETTLSAVAGCNTLGGSYLIEGSALTVTADVARTLMACPDPLAAQDTWLNSWLTGGLTIAGTDLGISLTGSGATVVLDEVSSGTEGDGIALVGPTFTLTSIEAGDAVSSLPAGVEAPTLVFADDGTVAVFTGCNRGSATYELAAGAITFGPLALTKVACEPGAQAVETTITTVLDGTVSTAWAGSNLTLATRDQSLVYDGAP